MFFFYFLRRYVTSVSYVLCLDVLQLHRRASRAELQQLRRASHLKLEGSNDAWPKEEAERRTEVAGAFVENLAVFWEFWGKYIMEIDIYIYMYYIYLRIYKNI